MGAARKRSPKFMFAVEFGVPAQVLATAAGRRLHAIIKARAPALSPTTWYGMPAYAKDGKVIGFFFPRRRLRSSASELRP